MHLLTIFFINFLKTAKSLHNPLVVDLLFSKVYKLYSEDIEFLFLSRWREEYKTICPTEQTEDTSPKILTQKMKNLTNQTARV